MLNGGAHHSFEVEATSYAPARCRFSKTGTGSMIPVLQALTKASADRFGGAPAWVLARSRRTPATWAGAGCAEGPPRVARLPCAAAPNFFVRGIGRANRLPG